MRVRLIDIAEATGVSKVTVSKVLSRTSGNNTQVSKRTYDRIMQTAREMGYQPNLAARQLAGQSSKLLGILMGANAAGKEFPRLVLEDRAANERGYRTLIGQCYPNEASVAKSVDDFSARLAVGVIVHANSYSNLCEHIIQTCSRFRHVVYYDRPNTGDDSKLNYVDIDLAAGMGKLVRHIAASGRRRISYFVPYKQFVYGKFRSFKERERGFREAMTELDLPFADDFNERYLFDEEPTCEQIGAAVRDLIKREKPEAIICRNDQVAAAVLKTLLEMGIKCPDDIAVAGYDNKEFAPLLYPGLTTVDLRLEEVSRIAVDTLIDLIEGKVAPDQPVHVSIEPELVIRQSI